MYSKSLETNFLEMKKNSEIFDINCWMTYYKDELLEDVHPEPEQYFAEGVNRMVLAHSRCKTEDFALANKALFEKVATDDRFYASPIVVPEMNLAGNKISTTIDEFIGKKAVIFRIFPKALKHSMKKWQMGNIFSAMEERRIPLMVWHTQIEWDTLAEIAEQYPNLPIILEGSDQKTIYYARDIMGICERYKNIYLEMHNYTQYKFLPYALEHIGAERMLFGSFSPYNDMNGVLYMIAQHTNEAQRELILSKNFERLMGEIKK
ncbi:MAG: amidohydrolase family protein [Clostridia bacterium]|nr:amidohydrolase family protein [Clostridia bacterium]